MTAAPPDEVVSAPPGQRVPGIGQPFFGREEEIARLVSLLGDGETRQVTLTGAGGIGKTRLAVQVATRLLRHLPGGAIFVPLASVTDPAVLLSTILAALGETSSEGDAGTRLVAALGQRSVLVLLDNLEHLEEAGTILAPVIEQTPGATWLMTSRSPLGIAGERVVQLTPLPLPDPGGDAARIDEAPSLQLFVACAREASPSFRLTEANTAAIVAICHQLQGLPLALELAAARIRSLGPETMTRILRRPSGSLDLLQGDEDDSLDQRHQTIRQTLLWSCEGLDPGPAALFRQLSVFPASFSLEAAEVVASAGSALAGIDALVRSSLVLYLPSDDGRSRYDLLQPVRELAREQLVAAGDRDATEDRFITWARAFTQERRVAWSATDPAEWMTSIQSEVENLRAAALLALSRRAIEDAIRIVAFTLWQYWGLRGQFRDDGAIIERIMAAASSASDPIPNDVLAAGFSALATRANGLGDVATARSAYERALALRRDSDDRIGLANTLNNFGLMLRAAGDLDDARDSLEESLALRRTFGHPRATGLALLNLGDLELQQRNLAAARARFDETLSMSEETGDYRLAGYALMNLGEVALAEDAPEPALSLAEQGLALIRHVGEPHGISQALEIAARSARRLGRTGDAAGFLSEALAVNSLRGDQPTVATNLEDIAVLLLDVPPAGQAPSDAILLLGAAAAVRERVGSETPTAVRDLIRALRTANPGPAFLVPWGDGRSLAPDRLLGEVERLLHPVRAVTILDAPQGPGSGDGSRAPAEPDALTQYRLDPLTAREQDVLLLLIDGLSDREIADALFISARTASNHVARILQKMQVGSRTAAASFALRHGLTQPSPPAERRRRA